MENAGAGAARIASDMLARGPRVVAVACGPGQNGGDGFVVARHLAVEGRRPRILLLPASGGGEPAGDAAVNLAACRAMGLPILTVRSAADLAAAAGELAGANLVVDALFGTGLSRALSGEAAELVRAVCASRRPVLALDIPSGLDCDTGEPTGPCVRADVTATFLAPKRGFANPAARQFTGEVRVVPIGCPIDWPPAPSPDDPAV
jgi:NAD(P)H-hydrate epimerase